MALRWESRVRAAERVRFEATFLGRILATLGLSGLGASRPPLRKQRLLFVAWALMPRPLKLLADGVVAAWLVVASPHSRCSLRFSHSSADRGANGAAPGVELLTGRVLTVAVLAAVTGLTSSRTAGLAVCAPQRGTYRGRCGTGSPDCSC